MNKTYCVHFERKETIIVDYTIEMTEEEIKNLKRMSQEEVDAFCRDSEKELDNEELESATHVYLMYVNKYGQGGNPAKIIWEGSREIRKARMNAELKLKEYTV